MRMNEILVLVAIGFCLVSCILASYVDLKLKIPLPASAWFFWGAITVLVPMFIRDFINKGGG